MSHRRRGRRPPGFTPSGCRELYDVFLPMRGAERRRFFNQISDRVVVMAGVAMAILGYGSGGPLGALVGLAAGLAGAARAVVAGPIPARMTHPPHDGRTPRRPRGAGRPFLSSPGRDRGGVGPLA